MSTARKMRGIGIVRRMRFELFTRVGVDKSCWERQEVGG